MSLVDRIFLMASDYSYMQITKTSNKKFALPKWHREGCFEGISPREKHFRPEHLRETRAASAS
jgi:hypothetical protein